MDRYEMMTTTPVPQLILKLPVPTVISMLVTGFYNTADTFFVGRISTQSIADVFSMILSVPLAYSELKKMKCPPGAGGADKYNRIQEVLPSDSA